jgi:thiamine biosynthesis lipoprotein
MRRTIVVAGLAMMGVPGGPGPAAAPGPAAGAPAAQRAGFSVRARHLMGTRLLIEAQGGDEGPIEAAFDEVARLEQVLSNWRADSEVSRLNAAAARAPVRCSPDLFAAVGSALEWAARTSGAFDPTVEPWVRRLGLRDPQDWLPGVVAPAETDGGQASGGIPAVGWRLVRTRPADRCVRFTRQGVGLDFGGIGKGIALDAAAKVLLEDGVLSARLDFGGQVLFAGTPPANGWRLALSDPGDRDRALEIVTVASGSVSTSGNQERSRTGPSGAVGHLLDPRTGRTASFDGSVTVRADDATSADALSTALFVMGPEHGLAWAEKHRVDAVYLSRDRSGDLVKAGTGVFAVVEARR